MHRLRIFTHESTIHSQIGAVEKALQREIDFTIILNKQGERSTIEFDATEGEMAQLHSELQYGFFIQDGARWLPYI